MKYVLVEKIRYAHNFDAYTKARRDTLDILKVNGFEQLLVEFVDGDRSSLISRFKRHFHVYKAFNNACKNLKKGDVLFIQYPEDNDCILFGFLLQKLKRRNVKTIALIHDLDLVRFGSKGYSKIGWIIKQYFEGKKIKSCDKLIPLNDKMKSLISDMYDIPDKRMSSLQIWDYLIPSPVEHNRDYDKTVVIAGNLDILKVKYIYNLPSNVKFSLYGEGYVDKKLDNVKYNGAVSPDSLPNIIDGDFGLIWDGDSIDSCIGFYGDYLRINNPHKTSLYLASGIPVIIWENAALADFVLENDCGITIDSLNSIQDKLNCITPERYIELKNNAKKVGEKLHKGYYLSNAIQNALD